MAPFALLASSYGPRQHWIQSIREQGGRKGMLDYSNTTLARFRVTQLLIMSDDQSQRAT